MMMMRSKGVLSREVESIWEHGGDETDQRVGSAVWDIEIGFSMIHHYVLTGNEEY